MQTWTLCKEETEIISLSIIDKSEKNSIDPPEIKPPSEDYDVDCDVTSMKKISVNNKDVLEMEAQCEGNISMKAKMYHYATNEKIISYAYMTSPALEFNNNINSFEESVKTLKIANQVSIPYEIPEEWKIKEVISDVRDTTVEAISETAEATENALSETVEETEELTSDITSGIEDNVKNQEEGGGCLIATAAYGSELVPQIQFLREIRDHTVMSTSSGAAFMTGFNQLYYSFSPTIADLERENPAFQEAVRLFITPMISTLSIMTLAEDGNEAQVLGLGISVIALNLGLYLVAPTAVGFKISRCLKSKNR